ncbi:hypothetical protein FGRMN_6751 [Fusarium graminum]|nr:hypothetical protein FGRMN_6751 [Fusarium graminum]
MSSKKAYYRRLQEERMALLAAMEEETYKAADSVYSTGKVLTLNIFVSEPSNHAQAALQVKVKEQKRPWTLSCGMIVETQETSVDSASLDGSTSSNLAFLKMFDRRFAVQYRQDEFIDTWSEDIERQLLRDLANGKVVEMVEKLETLPDFRFDTGDDWDEVEKEINQGHMMRGMFNTETAVYARLQDHQGKVIPRLLGSVTLAEPADLSLTPDQQDLYRHRGVLLEYLPGFTFSKIVENVPRTEWQQIIDQAVQIVHILGDNNVINYDVRPDNFMIVPENDKYKVFMIDFAQCRLRREDETDAEWGLDKNSRDETGAIAMVMAKRLKRVGFEVQHEHCTRYSEWGDRG